MPTSKKMKKSSPPKKVTLVEFQKKKGPARPRPRSTNTLVGVNYSEKKVQRPPKISSDRGGTTIKHRELLVAQVTINPTWNIAYELDLNPGLSGTFPWLQNIAKNYESYELIKCVFEFTPSVATTAPGTIYLTVDYDPVDAPPVNEQTMGNFVGTSCDSVWRKQKLSVDVTRALSYSISKRKFIREGAIGGDMKTYDFGTFYLSAANASGANVPVGQLWVDYEFRLFNPQLGNQTDQPRARILQSFTSNFTGQVIPKNTTTNLQFPTGSTQVNGQKMMNTSAAVNLGNGVAAIIPKGIYDVSLMGTFEDSTSEAFTGIVKLIRNGQTIVQGIFDDPTYTANDPVSILLKAAMSFNGTTDNLVVDAFLGGAAGVLKNFGTINFSPV